MFGPPKNVPGECNARLYIGDDYGDNRCTMRCKLPTGHGGKHKEIWRDGQCVVEWEGDDHAKDIEQDGKEHAEFCNLCQKEDK